jgi:cytoskeletal protein CcmA (bactofilin family)
MGVSGDTTRGAYWWAGGNDRININCGTGTVRIQGLLEGQVLKSDIIQGLSTTTVRIEDNVVITGNATFEGTVRIEDNVVIIGTATFEGDIIAPNLYLTQYWLAIKVAWDGTTLSSTGRHHGKVNKYGSYSGYAITFPAHPFGASAVVLVSSNEFTIFIVIKLQLVYEYIQDKQPILQQMLPIEIFV